MILHNMQLDPQVVDMSLKILSLIVFFAPNKSCELIWGKQNTKLHMEIRYALVRT